MSERITRSKNKKNVIETHQPSKRKQVKQQNKQVVNKKIKIKNQNKQPQKNKQETFKSQNLKKVIVKGNKIPVDQSVPINYKQKCTVLQKDGIVYSLMMNQTNINNNNNKFYFCQILEINQNPKKYLLFFKYGRVGQSVPMIITLEYQDMQNAINQFNRKVYEKSQKGNYKIVQIDFLGQDNLQKLTQKKLKHFEESKLPKPVKELIQMIFDIKMMNNQMKQIGYDAKKMPLGKLAKSSIQKGYQILNQLANEIAKKKPSNKIIDELSNQFYTFIPHDFGRNAEVLKSAKLDNQIKIKEKLKMLQSLQEIQIATQILDQHSTDEQNLIDKHYQHLKCQLKPIDKNSDIYKLLTQYVNTTHGKTHTAYKLQVQDIFEIYKQQDQKRFKKDIHNKMLLWHGSRMTNYVGILSQGLRIAPPEAPVTGYMFGKGVYFADAVTKSAQYCFCSRQNNTGLMLLGQLALGNMNQKKYADYHANNLPQNMHSTKGVGKNGPNQKNYKKIGDVIIPLGPLENTGVQYTSLLYHEYIVYDVSQVKLKYLLKMKFIYN